MYIYFHHPVPLKHSSFACWIPSDRHHYVCQSLEMYNTNGESNQSGPSAISRSVPDSRNGPAHSDHSHWMDGIPNSVYVRCDFIWQNYSLVFMLRERHGARAARAYGTWGEWLSFLISESIYCCAGSPHILAWYLGRAFWIIRTWNCTRLPCNLRGIIKFAG